MPQIDLHSVVALLNDVPNTALSRGQVGTVVGEWAPDVYEVEFCDLEGQTYALVELRAEQLMRLHHEPANRAA